MAHTFTNLLYHIIFSTKDRRPQITPELMPDLQAYLGGIVRQLGGVAIEIGGVEDHVHILAKLKPTVTISESLNKIKSNSSGWVHETKPASSGFAWQEGYGAFTVSESQVDLVRQYIRNQEEHHRKQSFHEEYIEFLKRHEVEYDPRYVWE